MDDKIIRKEVISDTNIDKTSNTDTKKTSIGVKTTQDTAGETLKKTLDTIVYTNPLLQQTKPEDLIQQNFPRYQKDVKNILLQLLGQISFIRVMLKPEKLDQKDRLKDNLTEAKRLCKFLEEYCDILKKEMIPLPYKYLGSITHSTKRLADQIELQIEEYNNIKDLGKKNNRINEETKYISSIIDNISKKIEDIGNIHLTESNMYIKKTFSPFKESQKIIDMYNGNIKSKNIQIENNLPQNLSIESYQNIFEITMENLISNAIKFTPNGGTIHIEIKNEHSNTISFSIKDTGIGIPSETDVFARGYTTPSLEGKQGTGLGLADSKLFIEMMGEKIEYKNNIPRGTIFTFCIKKTPSQKDLQK